MPEENKVAQHIIEYVQQLQLEDREINNAHPLGQLKQAFQEVQRERYPMLPLAVISPPKYDGNPKQSVTKFIQDVEDDVTTNATFPLTNMQKVQRLRTHLRGRARQWFDGLPDHEKDTFEHACEAIRVKFNDKLVKRLADTRLVACYQKAEETVHSFSERLAEIINTVMEGETAGEQERTLNREFKHRLIPRIRAEVLRINPDNYEESLALALQYEVYADELRFLQQPAAATTTTVTTTEQSSILVAQPRQIVCYYCGKMGHMKRECRKRQNDQRNQNANRNFGWNRNRNSNYNGNNNYNNNNQNRQYNGYNNRGNNYRNFNNYNNRNGQNFNNNGNRNNRNFNNGNDQGYRNSNSSSRNPSVEFQRYRNNSDTRYPSRSSSPDDRRSPSSRPTVRFSAQTLPLFSILLIALCLPLGHAVNSPLLCMPDAPTTLWTLNKDPICANADFTADDPVVSTTWKILRQNTIQYSTTAVHCQCYRTTVEEWTNFIGKFRRTERVESLPMSINDCLLMNSTSNSHAGMLLEVQDYFATNNTVTMDTPIWPFSMSTTTGYTENCYKYYTKIFTRYGITEIQAAFNFETPCHYQKGSCQMDSQGVLIWVPERNQQCKFIELATWNGTYSSQVWLADSKDFALSFTNPELVEDCNQTILVADQQYAITQLQYNDTLALLAAEDKAVRSKRDVGLVYTSQLAAQLSAIQENTLAMSKKLFTSGFRQICSAMQAIAEATIALAAANPTLLARQLLNLTTIRAQLVAPRILEIHSCIPLPPEQVHFVPQDICYNKLPVQFIHQHVKYTAFLNTITMILETTAEVVPCETQADLYLFTHRLQRFNQKTGYAEYIDETKEISSFKTIDFPMLMEHVNPIRNLVLANLSEVYHAQTFHHAAAKIQAMHNIIHQMNPSSSTKIYENHPHFENFSSKVVSAGLFSFLQTGVISIYQLWIFASCCYVTLQFVLTMLSPILRLFFGNVNFFELGRRLWTRWRNRRQQSSEQEMVPNPQHQQQAQAEVEELEAFLHNPPVRQQMPSTIQMKWPSGSIIKQNNQQFQTLTTFVREEDEPTLVWGQLNNNKALYLLDTGAKRSIVNQAFVDRYNIPTVQQQPDIELTGIAGRNIVTEGQIIANIQLALIKIQLLLFIVPNYDAHYDVILGENAFQLMPPVTFDYQQRRVSFQHSPSLGLNGSPSLLATVTETIPIVTDKKQSEIIDLRSQNGLRKQ